MNFQIKLSRISEYSEPEALAFYLFVCANSMDKYWFSHMNVLFSLFYFLSVCLVFEDWLHALCMV